MSLAAAGARADPNLAHAGNLPETDEQSETFLLTAPLPFKESNKIPVRSDDPLQPTVTFGRGATVETCDSVYPCQRTEILDHMRGQITVTILPAC